MIHVGTGIQPTELHMKLNSNYPNSFQAKRNLEKTIENRMQMTTSQKQLASKIEVLGSRVHSHAPKAGVFGLLVFSLIGYQIGKICFPRVQSIWYNSNSSK